MTEDKDLIQRTLAGDHSAFDELVRRHREQVFGTAFRLVRNRHSAEEIAQEAFLRVFRSLRTFRNQARFTTWLYRITVNLCMNHLRKENPSAEAVIEVADTSPTPSEKLAEQDRRQWLEQEIEKLPPTQKAVLVLRINNSMSFKDIARTVGCTAGSAKVNFRHALLKLKKRFDGLSEEL